MGAECECRSIAPNTRRNREAGEARRKCTGAAHGSRGIRDSRPCRCATAMTRIEARASFSPGQSSLSVVLERPPFLGETWRNDSAHNFGNATPLLTAHRPCHFLGRSAIAVQKRFVPIRMRFACISRTQRPDEYPRRALRRGSNRFDRLLLHALMISVPAPRPFWLRTDKTNANSGI